VIARRRRPDAPRSEINVTPLVDVVLVLLLIFMVVTPLLHRGVPVELPASAAHERRPDGALVVLSLTVDGRLFLDGRPLAPDGLGDVVRAARGRELHLQADRRLAYGAVRRVLERLHAAGAAEVGLATIAREAR